MNVLEETVKTSLRLVAVLLAALLAGGVSAALPELTGQTVAVASADPVRACSGGAIYGVLANPGQHDYYTMYVAHNATITLTGHFDINNPISGAWLAYPNFQFNPLWDGSLVYGITGTYPAGPVAAPYTQTWTYPGASGDITLDLSEGGGINLGYDLGLTISATGGPTCPPGPVTASESRGCNPAEVNLAAAQHNCADPVDTATGNFHEDFTDLSIPGRGIPLNYTRSYNSDPKSTLPSGPLGYGWTDSYHMNLSVTNTTLAAVTQETGAQVSFNLAGSGWVPVAPRIVATLAHNGDGTWTFTRRGTQIFTFNSAGQLTAEQDLSGQHASTPYVTTLAYNGSGQLSTVTDPAGRTFTFAYWPTGTGGGKDGLLHTLTDSAGRTVTYDYADGNSNLTDVVDAGGGHWQFTYNSDHRVLTKREPKYYGDTTTTPTPVVTNDYDTLGRVTYQHDALGDPPTEFHYSTTADYSTTTAAVPGTTVVKDPKGNQTSYSYPGALLTSEIKGYGTPQAATWSYQYDPAGTLGQTQITEPTVPAHHFTYGYDANGNRNSSSDDLGRSASAVFNPLNLPTTVTDGKHVPTTNDYDAWGNLKSTSTPWVEAPSGAPPNQVTTYHHDDAAHPSDITSVTDADGKLWHYGYDGAGNLTSQTDPLSEQTKFCYDSAGRRTAQIDPLGVAAGVDCSSARPAAHTTYFSYDAYGDLLSSTDPLGNATANTYDANRNLHTSTDGNLQQTSYQYDPADRITEVDRPGTTPLYNHYWEDGTLKNQVDGAGAVTAYTYDQLAHLQTVTDPATTAYPTGRVTTYNYDAVGNLITKQDQGGSCSSNGCTTYGYDAADQLKTITYSDGTTPNVTNIGYDSDGQRTSMTDGTGTSSWTWDSLHRLTVATDGAGKTITNGYNLRNELTSIAYPDSAGTVTRDYDDAGRLDWVKDWNNQQTTFNYDADSFLKTQSYPNGVVAAFTPDGGDNLTSIADTKGATTLASFNYGTRDGNNQVKNVTSTGVPSDNHSYSYTQLNQLKTQDSGNFGYDTADNPTGLADGTSQGFDPANQLCFSSPSGGSGTCAAPPTASGTQSFSYDNRGNRTQVATVGIGDPTTYKYDQANRLTSVAVPTGANQGGYTSLPPARILTTSIPANTDTLAQITGLGGVPSSGVSAVVINVTVTSPSFTGSAVLWANGDSKPNTSNINFVAGQNISGLSIVKVGTGGKIEINSSSAAGVIFDVEGYYSTANGNSYYNPLTPHRIMDTRPGAGRTGSCPTDATPSNCVSLAGSNRLDLQVTGKGTVPSSGVQSVAINLTVTNTPTAGNLKVWANGDTEPTVSNINYSAGQTLALLVIVKVSSGGRISIKGSGASGTHVDAIVDVEGWFGDTSTTGAAYTAIAPSRILDTRSTGSYVNECPGTLPYGFCPSPWEAGGSPPTVITHDVQIAGKGGVPASGIQSVVLNLTVVNPTAAGYAQIWQKGTTQPNPGSTLNYLSGQTVANTAIVPLSSDGRATFYTQASADIIIDVAGYNKTPPTTTSTYTYNGDGLRVGRTVASTTTHQTWDPVGGTQLLVDGTTNYIYGLDGQPLEQVNGSTTRYYHQDQLGSTRMLTDSTGTSAATYIYNAFGKLTNTPAVTTPLGYAGQYTDPETGFQYLRARYYDPSTAQFLTRDPADARTRSAYAYANNNPLNSADPTGLGAGENLVDFGAGILNAGLSTVTMGALHVDPPYCNSGAYMAGNITGVLAGVALTLAFAPEALAAEEEASGWTTVGRWMNPEEHAGMLDSEVVQWGEGGVSHVLTPPDPLAYRAAPPNSIYVEYEVPTTALNPHSAGSSIIYGPDSFVAKLPGRAVGDVPVRNIVIPGL